MTANYEVLVLDTTGALKAVFDAPRDITLDLLLNGISTHQISFGDGDSRLTEFVADAGVVVRRKGDWVGATWDVIYDGLHRTDEHQVSDLNVEIFTTYGRSLMDLLKRRYVQYFSTTAFTEKNGPTETVMKQFVEENAGASASSANGRFRTVTTPITVEADAGQGSTWAGARAFDNLLELCQELAQFGSVDFDVVRVGGTGVVFEFQTHYPRIGVDRRATPGNANAHIFSPDFGNVVTPSLSKTRTEEVAAVTALGQGEGTSRAFVVEENAIASESPWSDIELVVDASNEVDAEGLDAVALAKLDESGPADELVFQTAQIEGSKFGRDYNLGDWITARFGAYQHDLRIIAVNITVSDGQETIRIQCADPDTRPPTTASLDPIAQLAATLTPVLAPGAPLVAIPPFSPSAQTNPIPGPIAIDLPVYPVGTAPPPPMPGAPGEPDPVRLFIDNNGDINSIDPAGNITNLSTGGGTITLTGSIETTVGDGQNVIAPDIHDVVNAMPYNMTVTAIHVQSVQGDIGSATINIQTYTPGASPTYTTVATIALSSTDHASSSVSISLTAGQGVALDISGISVFTELGVSLVGTHT